MTLRPDHFQTSPSGWDTHVSPQPLFHWVRRNAIFVGLNAIFSLANDDSTLAKATSWTTRLTFCCCWLRRHGRARLWTAGGAAYPVDICHTRLFVRNPAPPPEGEPGRERYLNLAAEASACPHPIVFLSAIIKRSGRIISQNKRDLS